MRRFFLLLCLLSSMSCQERAAPKVDHKAHLKRLRQCRAQLETSLVERLAANPPDDLVRGLTVVQRPVLAERLYQAIYEGFFLGGPDRDLTAYLKDSPARPCFGEKECAGFARCVAGALAGTAYAGLEDLELPAPQEPAPDPTAVPTDPPPVPEPAITKERFDLSQPDPRLDWGIPWDPAAPRLWYATRDRLRLVAPGDGKMNVQKEIRLQESWSATDDVMSPEVHVTGHGAVLVRTTRTLLLVDREGGLHAVWRTAAGGKKIGAMTLWEDRIVMAAEGGLIVLDATFRELGRVSFGLGAGKDGHDVLMHGDEALVLDNRAVPFYLFRVDLQDPRAPRILDDVVDHATSAHLLHQWTDEKAGLWAVLRSTYGMGGYAEVVLAMDLKKPAARVKHELPPGVPIFIGGHPSVRHTIGTYSDIFRGPSPPSKANPDLRTMPMAIMKRMGVRFRAGSSLPPGWVLATDDRGLYLGYFKLVPPKAEFEIGRTIVSYGPTPRRPGRLRLDKVSEEEEDPFSHAQVECVMDHREQLIVLVLPDKVQVLDVTGDRVRTVVELANPPGLPAHVRIHHR